MKTLPVLRARSEAASRSTHSSRSARSPRPTSHLGAAAAGLLALGLVLAAGSGPAQAAAGSAPSTTPDSAAKHPSATGPKPNLVVRPQTGEGCHQYDWWDGYDICIMVWGSGLNVKEVEGWVDGRNGASDLTHLYTTDGDLNVEDVLNGAGQSWFDWSVGGGIWLTNYQNICFQDVTINQTACLYLNVS